MTTLIEYTKALTSLEAIDTALTAAQNSADGNENMAQFDELTKLQCLQLLQSYAQTAIENPDIPIATFKETIGQRLYTTVKSGAERIAKESLNSVHGELTSDANPNYVRRAKEFLLERFDMLVEMYKDVAKPHAQTHGDGLSADDGKPRAKE